MKAFAFARPKSTPDAVETVTGRKDALLKAGGIDLLDRMKERTAEPGLVVSLLDVGALEKIEMQDDGGLRIGAGVTLAALAGSKAVAHCVPILAEAAGQAASPQLRHRATLGGNLAQHTRCGYYRHRSFPCLKRGGNQCPVRKDGGVQDTAGIFANDVCASAHPSSVAPVLGAVDAVLHIVGPAGPREVPFAEAWLAPEPGRAADLDLRTGDVIESIEVPGQHLPQKTAHEEIRQRAAFDWALATCAVRLAMDGEVVRDARVWLGAVAPTPWRATGAEDVLRGKRLTDTRAAEAGEAAIVGASPLEGTTYKVNLVRVAVRRALVRAGKE